MLLFDQFWKLAPILIFFRLFHKTRVRHEK